MKNEYIAVLKNFTLADKNEYLLYNDTNIEYLNSQYKYYQIGPNSGFFDWIGSKGTNYSCFVNYYNNINNEDHIDLKINIFRTIIYAMSQPFQSAFFYWTLLLFILHKFNFKKPVMKVILLHFVLRSIGDILDKFGDLMPHYFANQVNKDKNGAITGYDCYYGRPSAEQHPLKWFLTRQIGNTFWYTGEIAADLYPLLRTKAVAKDRSIWFVYISCGLFNIAKIVLISIHYFLSPTVLYTNNNEYGYFIFARKKINMFYFLYWVVQFNVIITSLIYDFTVFLVLKKNVFEITQSEFGFLKKFRNISEFRIIVSILICIFLLPVICVTYVLKFYFYYKYQYDNLNFSFDDVRRLIANVQYFMIFIDQILLLRSKEDSSFGETNDFSKFDSTNKALFKNSNIDSKLYYSNLLNINNKSNIGNNSFVGNKSTSSIRNSFASPRFSHPNGVTDASFSGGNVGGKRLSNNINNATQRYSHPDSLMEYSFSGDLGNNNNNINTSQTNANVRNSSQLSPNPNATPGKTNTSNRNKSIANYDEEYDGIPNEWSYLRR